eukprot:Pgem_evm1s17283
MILTAQSRIDQINKFSMLTERLEMIKKRLRVQLNNNNHTQADEEKFKNVCTCLTQVEMVNKGLESTKEGEEVPALVRSLMTSLLQMFNRQQPGGG